MACKCHRNCSKRANFHLMNVFHNFVWNFTSLERPKRLLWALQSTRKIVGDYIIREIKKCILDRTHFLPSNDKVSKWMISHTNWLWNNSLENFLWKTDITQIWLFCVKFTMEFTGQQTKFSVELVTSFSKGTCFNFAARIVEFFGCKT